MNYLIIFDDVTAKYDRKDIHEKITKHLSVTKWWHYLAHGYIVVTPVLSSRITNSLANWFPGMLFLVIEVNLVDASGVLPKEAFDWIRNNSGKSVKIKTKSLPNIKIGPTMTPGISLRSILATPKREKTIGELLRSAGINLSDIK